MFLDTLKLIVEKKKNVEGKLFRKYGLRNLPEELVLSPESAKDFKRFHGFSILFYFVFAFFTNSAPLGRVGSKSPCPWLCLCVGLANFNLSDTLMQQSV